MRGRDSAHVLHAHPRPDSRLYQGTTYSLWWGMLGIRIHLLVRDVLVAWEYVPFGARPLPRPKPPTCLLALAHQGIRAPSADLPKLVRALEALFDCSTYTVHGMLTARDRTNGDDVSEWAERRRGWGK